MKVLAAILVIPALASAGRAWASCTYDQDCNIATQVCDPKTNTCCTYSDAVCTSTSDCCTNNHNTCVDGGGTVWGVANISVCCTYDGGACTAPWDCCYSYWQYPEYTGPGSGLYDTCTNGVCASCHPDGWRDTGLGTSSGDGGIFGDSNCCSGAVIKEHNPNATCCHDIGSQCQGNFNAPGHFCCMSAQDVGIGVDQVQTTCGSTGHCCLLKNANTLCDAGWDCCSGTCNPSTHKCTGCP
jgi:hypothetical protein